MEKFGILNLLKALETLAPAAAANPDGNRNAQPTPDNAATDAPQPEKQRQRDAEELPNMMAQVLARHEEIANRVKNNRR